jgi:hypothetical protein
VCEASARFCRHLAHEHEKAAIVEAAAAAPTPFARNIQRLRLECGWSYDDLTGSVDMDRSTVIDHATKVTQPWPATVKKYADAFTKALHRSISPAELMVDVVKRDPK